MIMRLIVILFAWLIGWQAPAWASITFDAESHSDDTVNSSTVSWPHTIGSGSDRYLLVAIQTRGTTKANLAANTVTCGGTPLTKIREDTLDSPDLVYFFRVELWALVAPSVGTCTIAVSLVGVATQYVSGSALSYFGVHQTTPVHAQGGNAGSNATGLSTTITTTSDGVWIMDAVVGRAASAAAPLSVGANQVAKSVRAVGITTGEDGVGLSYVAGKTPAGNEVMDWTQASASDWVQSVVALLPTTISTPAAASVVQSCSLAKVNNGVSVSCTLPSLPAAGSTIIVPMSFGQFGAGQSTCVSGSVTDSQGNGFDLALESPLVGRVRSYIWFKQIVTAPGGSYSVTITCPSASWITMKAVEVSGLVPSYAAFDRPGWTGATGTSILTVQPFLSTTQPNELVVAVVAVDTAATSVTITETGGYTVQYEQENCDTAGSGSICGSAVTKLLSTTGVPAQSWTFSIPVTSAAAIATFKASNSGVGTIIRSLTWQDNATNETGFRVQKRTDATFPTWVDVASGLPPNTTAYAATISTLETGDCWRVLAENANGSAVSNEFCPTAVFQPLSLPPPPSVLQIGGLQPLMDDELL